MTKRRTKKELPSKSVALVQAEVSKLINQIQAIDRTNLFLYDPVVQFPVIAEQYKKVCPKRIWTTRMRYRNQALEYPRFSDWLSDFELMIKNCLLFNAREPAYSKEAQRIYTEAIAYIQPIQDRLGITSPMSEALTGDQLASEKDCVSDLHEPLVVSAGKDKESDVVKFPDALHNFLIQHDIDMQAKFANSANRDAFPQFCRVHSMRMIMCFFYVQSKATLKLEDNVKRMLEDIIRLFDKVADSVLFYEDEREIFITKLSGKESDDPVSWSENLGVDAFLRFAFHFPSIARAASWLPEETKECCHILESVLEFIEKYLPQICEVTEKRS
ncbi:hypothetical protein XU18_0543 [Perkinsela sp. CCAP 1560/4]|nr:hypothetical protein XU18_0543 [Perkinsela sp. CCAP 1560/4]|eukprot:KNH09265.1 hypothetical protein XU18_0543 [Perkinsela sp. CCAP 1560/4]